MCNWSYARIGSSHKLETQIYYLRSMRIFVLVALILTGVVAGVAAMALVLLLTSSDLSTLMDQEKLMGGSIGRTRLLLVINHVTMFMLPALAWAFIYYKRKWFSGLGLKSNISWSYVFMGILFLMAGYPIVAKSYELNQMIQLPEWMNQMEGQTAELMRDLLVMNSPLDLIANVIVIGIIPGIGEELIFRGIIQREFQSYFKSPILAVVIASFIFSAMHFQFAGFLPRFLLGMILGLLLYWTNNLWIPILVHAFNNAFQVILSYFNPTMMDQDFEKSVPVSWYVLIIGVVLTVLLGRWFQQRKPNEPEIALQPIQETPPLPPVSPEDQNPTV